MTILLSSPDATTSFGSVSVGFGVTGCLMLALIALALGFGIYQTRRMKQQMNLLDDETRARRSQERELEEQLCGTGSGAAGPRRVAPTPMKDPWQS